MNDDWMRSPFEAMRSPLPGDQLDTLSQLTQPQMPVVEEPEPALQMNPVEMMAAQIAERAVAEKAISQRAQLAVAQRNDAELKKAS